MVDAIGRQPVLQAFTNVERLDPAQFLPRARQVALDPAQVTDAKPEPVTTPLRATTDASFAQLVGQTRGLRLDIQA
jgi:hypothetical protein